jgi:hypothetical protein
MACGRFAGTLVRRTCGGQEEEGGQEGCEEAGQEGREEAGQEGQEEGSSEEEVARGAVCRPQ